MATLKEYRRNCGVTELSTPQFAGETEKYLDERYTGCSLFWPIFETGAFQTQEKNLQLQ